MQADERAPRGVRIIRAVTGGLAVSTIVFSIAFDAIAGGHPGFGVAQAILLAFGIGTGLFCFLPAEWNERYLLVLCATAVSAALAEGALRVVFGKTLAAAVELDSRYFYKLTPNAQRVFTHSPNNGGRRIEVQVNSEGFRGREFRRDGPKRVIVYGDSCIEAEFSELGQTFVGKLESKLQTKLPGVEVINAGVIGYGPDQSSLRMEDELPRLKPDLVILALYPNDFGDMLRNKLFKLDERGQLVKNVPQISEALKASFRRAKSGLYLAKTFHKIWARFHPSPVPTPDSDLLRCRDEYESYVKNGNNEPEDPLNDHWDADISLQPDGASARYKKDLMVEMLRRVKDLAAKQGEPLVLMFIASPIDACDGYDGRQVDPTKYPAYERSTLTDAMAEAATRADVSYVNLFPIFRAQADPNKLYFHGSDDHWNDAGQELGAQEMAEYILSKGLLQ